MAAAIAEELGLEVVSAAAFPDAPVLEAASTKFIRQFRAVPLSEETDGLVIAMVDPLDPHPIISFRMLSGKPVRVCVITATDLERVYERLYGGDQDSMNDIIDEIDAGEESKGDEDVARLRDLASEAPVIRLVNLLIARAIEGRASDIHIEPIHDRLARPLPHRRHAARDGAPPRGCAPPSSRASRSWRS